jgi:Domain of unknown function (DUF4062)
MNGFMLSDSRSSVALPAGEATGGAGPWLGLAPETDGGPARRRRRVPKFRRAVRIFVSSPGDLQAERQLVAGVIERLQQIPSMARQFALQPLLWERAVPPVLGPSPQSAIDLFMAEPDRVELFVMLIGNRLGSPLIDHARGEPFSSGTAYELETAYRSYRRHRRPSLLVYRCTRPPDGPADPVEQERVATFWNLFPSRYAGIRPKEFQDARVLQDLLFTDLATVIERLYARENTLRRLWQAALVVLSLVAGWQFHGRYQAHAVAHQVDAIVDTALADSVSSDDAEGIWDRATQRLLALGPLASNPVFRWLRNPSVYDRVDQRPTVALVQVLARAAASDPSVCPRFAEVLSTGVVSPSYPKSTHRIVIREGLRGGQCPGVEASLCDYLAHVSRSDFVDRPEEWVDLRDAATPILLSRAGPCSPGTPGGGKR